MVGATAHFRGFIERCLGFLGVERRLAGMGLQIGLGDTLPYDHFLHPYVGTINLSPGEIFS